GRSTTSAERAATPASSRISGRASITRFRGHVRALCNQNAFARARDVALARAAALSAAEATPWKQRVDRCARCFAEKVGEKLPSRGQLAICVNLRSNRAAHREAERAGFFGAVGAR